MSTSQQEKPSFHAPDIQIYGDLGITLDNSGFLTGTWFCPTCRVPLVREDMKTGATSDQRWICPQCSHTVGLDSITRVQEAFKKAP